MTGHRILHVLPSVVPTDGIARAVRELAARVPGEHHLVTNRAHGPLPGFRSLTEIGGANSSFTFRHAAELGDLVDCIDPDVVHIHGGSLATTMAYSPAFNGRRIVVGMHKWLQRPAWGELQPTRWQQRRASSVPPLLALGSAVLSAPLNRIAARGRVAGVLSPDPRIIRRLSGASRRPVVFAPGGAEVDGLRARFSTAPRIGFAGKAESARGVDLLLAAFELVHRKIPAARLELSLLRTPESAELVGRIERSRLAGSITASVDPVPDVRVALSRCQVAVFPFRIDATITPTLSAAEALSVGVPVVATAVGCLAPLIRPGRNGELVPVGDVAALAAAIVQIIANQSHWEQLSQGAVDSIASDWSWDGAAAVTAALYERLVLNDARHVLPAAASPLGVHS